MKPSNPSGVRRSLLRSRLRRSGSALPRADTRRFEHMTRDWYRPAMRPRKETAVTVEQACDAIGVSRSTLWRMIRRGELPSFRRSGRRLVPLHALSGRQIRRTRKVKPFTLEHPLWRLVGAFRSGGVGPGSEDKHEILAK